MDRLYIILILLIQFSFCFAKNIEDFHFQTTDPQNFFLLNRGISENVLNGSKIYSIFNSNNIFGNHAKTFF